MLARDDVNVQATIGRASTLIRSARAFMYDTAGTHWDALVEGRDS